MSEVDLNSKASFGEKISTELREFFIIAAYLYVCFTALAYLKASILHANGIDFTPWAFAAIKAALCAKFMLIGRALHIGDGYKTYPLIIPTLYKSFAFLALVSILTIVEEIAVGFIHGRKAMDSIAEIEGGTLNQVIATSFVVLLIFIPYFAFRSLGNIIGDKVLVRLYFERRH